MAADDIPTLVKHVALAIYESGWAGPDVLNPTAAQAGPFTHCLDAARWRLVQYGYLRNGSQHGPPSNITLTAKGKKRNLEHRRESDFKKKEEKFRKLYELIDTEVEDPIGDREEDSDTDQIAAGGDREQKEKEAQLIRRADVAAKQPMPKRGSNKMKKARTRRVRRRW